jgi:two-component system sensor histidine kinase MprB
VSLRLRIAAAGGVAVALAVLAAAVAIYLAVRSDLRGQIDQSLTQRAQEFVRVAPLAAGAFPGGVGPVLRARTRANGQGPLPKSVQPGRFGGAAGYVQFVSAKGAVDAPGGQGSTPQIPPDSRDRQIAASGHGSTLTDRTVKGTHLRVLTLGTPGVPARAGGGSGGATGGSNASGGSSKAVAGGSGGDSSQPPGSTPGASPDTTSVPGGLGTRGAVMIARPLTEVDHELHRILLILLIVGISGIAIAAVLGAFVARTALAPIARFTRRTESLAGELDLSERLDVSGGEELERLATSFNTTLDALQRSLASQRRLIADASHELRTPIASLRANIQTLEDAHRLPVGEQQRLRADIVDELDELTTLVGDVVELARGSRAPAEREDVRLDELVAEAVARTRRRGDLQFELELAPTVVRGEADRINRAISNLLDNARKWSPPGGTIELTLREGVLCVRDHGPGFAEADLEKVFERFYRSASARKLPGSGLGLAIVRQAAEAHGGYARAANAAGGGARLEVSFGAALPFAPQAGPPAAATGD